MQLNSTENWINLIQLIKNLSLMLRKLNIEIFSIFCFCIIFLIENHEEKHDEKHKEKHEEKYEEKHEDHLIENHDNNNNNNNNNNKFIHSCDID